MKKRKILISLAIIFTLALVLPCSFVRIQASVKIPVEPITAHLEEYIGNINSFKRWDHLDDNNWTYSIVEVKPGNEISFKCYGQFFIAFLTSYNKPVKGENPDFITIKDYKDRLEFRAGVHKLLVPEGAHYLYFSRLLKGSDSTPRYLYIEYENVLEGNYPDNPQRIFDDYPENKQQICIHHDSFCREITNKKWHIGTNGGEVFTMDYLSPRPDYEYVDDGFRIVDGRLKNDQNVNISEAFRLLNRRLYNESLFEVNIPSENESERLVFNYWDSNNFESFQITESKKHLIVYYISRVRAKEKKELVLKKRLKGKAFRFFVTTQGTVIFLDNQRIKDVDYKLNTSLQYGLMIDNKKPYAYRFYNVFLLAPYKVYDESRFTDNGTKLTHAGLKQGWVKDYSFALNSEMAYNSPYSERFELRRNTITDYTNDRVEKSFNYQLQTNLRKITIDFDVFVPLGYEEDESPDCIMQIHDRPDEDSMEGRSPYFAIRIIKNHFVYSAQSIEKKALSGYNINKILPIDVCKLGEWSHFSIYIKEGYIPEHNPVTRIVINNKLVYESTDPNTNNNPRGGYVRYGIYKADWLKGIGDVNIQKKVLYFDNFMIRM